jgi:dTDP-4-amino-4,6-dideoxygalactose transaminase
MIPYSKPYISNKDIELVTESLKSGKLSGDGKFTKIATELLEKIVGSKILLTTSCTDALEMSAILTDIKYGDEVIIPSYTFVSTALPFESRGAKIIFADSEIDRPHLDIDHVLSLVSSKTKAIVPVHYGGEAANILRLKKNIDESIFLIEDNAQGITSKYLDYSLGTIGNFGTISFHDTKNITSGEGGALIINQEEMINRAEIIREKGTNRSSFFRGEIDKYGWVDIGSSFLPSDILSSLLYSQLKNIDYIQNKRLHIYNTYLSSLSILNEKNILTPVIKDYSIGNGHIYYLVCNSLNERINFINFMKLNGVFCASHYISLHSSKYFASKYDGRPLLNSDRFTDCLVRLPSFVDMTNDQQNYIINKTKEFFNI